MATAGCGSHTAAIYDRGGALLTHADVLTQIEWTRTLNDVSTARLVIQPGADCCERLQDVRSWRTKVVIWRDGSPVWEGPIVRVKWSVTEIELQCADIAGWLGVRLPHQTITFGDSDLVDIAAWLIEDAFRPDDPGHKVDIVAPSRVRGRRDYFRDGDSTLEHLKDLAETGLDWTAVGSTIVLLPEDHLVSVGTLTDADLPEGLTVTEDGEALATRWVVFGQDDQASQDDDDEGDPPSSVKGVAGGRAAYYGLIERAVEENSIKTSADAAAAARSRLRGSKPAPIYIDSDRVTLAPDAAVEVARLVPGWCVDVVTTETCRPIAQRMKIQTVTVTESGQSSGGDAGGTSSGGESVQLKLAPTGVGMDEVA